MAYNGHGGYSSGASSSSSGSSSTAGSGGKRVRTVTLIRRPGVRLGFSLRGGKEHGTGFFVTAVEPNTEASQQGLLAGDQILRVNGFPVEDATHKEVLQLILGQTTVSFKVKSVGMIPVKETAEDELSWQLVDSKPNTAPPLTNNDVHHHHHHQLDVYKPDPNDDPPGITRQMMTDVKMILKVAPRAKLGCGICKGPEWKPGVFVQFTKENSIARLAGLRPGDQILQCNNFRFTPETAFSEAVSVMRCSGVLELIVRKGAGLDLFPGESSGYNSSASSVAGDNPPRLSNINEDCSINNHQTPVNDHVQYNGQHSTQTERINGDHSNNDTGRPRAYPSGSTVIHVGGDETDNHKIAEIRMVSQQLETKTTTVFVEVHHSEEDNVSRTQSETSTDRLTNSSSVSSFTSSASSLSSAISQELERRSKRTSLDATNRTNTQTDKLIKSGLAKEKVQQHEQLMLEFKKAHKKMFSTDDDGNATNHHHTASKEEREELRLQSENTQNRCNDSTEKCKKIETLNKSGDQQEKIKTKRQCAPPPPPPLPSGTVVKEEKSTQKLSTTSLQAPSSKKQPAPPPPPPSPPYCPTPDYDTASLASQMTSDDNNKNGGESDTVKRRAVTGGKVNQQQQKSDIVEMQSLESFKLTNPSKVKPKPPNTYFTTSSSNHSDTSTGTASTVPIKDCVAKPIVTIREYPGTRERKNPTKFDFLQNLIPSQPIVDDKQPIASRLQDELSQTLQRATTLTKNEVEVGGKLQNGQLKNGGTVVTINISAQQNNAKNDLGKQPFYLFPNGKVNGVENKKINDLMQQSSTSNNNNKSYIANGKTKSSIDHATKNSVTFNFNNKTHESRSANIVQPNGILKNGNNVSQVQIQSQIPQQKSIKFGGI
ncbi:uncharacterized protein isoform X2 [Rhodnius prolixus]